MEIRVQTRDGNTYVLSAGGTDDALKAFLEATGEWTRVSESGTAVKSRYVRRSEIKLVELFDTPEADEPPAPVVY